LIEFVFGRLAKNRQRVKNCQQKRNFSRAGWFHKHDTLNKKLPSCRSSLYSASENKLENSGTARCDRAYWRGLRRYQRQPERIAGNLSAAGDNKKLSAMSHNQ
jgi:hypothetical protein